MPAETETANKPKHYKELLIWQRGMTLAKEIYRLTATFPAEEKFGLTTQMRRAAVSIPSNIAEGQARRSTREFVQFLSLANGSLAELETQLRLSADLKYADAVAVSGLEAEIGEMQRMILAVQRRLEPRGSD